MRYCWAPYLHVRRGEEGRSGRDGIRTVDAVEAVEAEAVVANAVRVPRYDTNVCDCAISAIRLERKLCLQGSIESQTAAVD